ncbi:unnamed protein product [Oppiella nova]|uniref:AMP-binding enzyme C-terminal domain-containing protein n=1 Tax=Oppiella nova TaxID=334625 RepID=A0A7R9LJR3_9ACAR|nr:unnamed protein product [Oppiella nova]CAG2164238.1 unnamed protein product [Oppiella nova]
MSGTFVSKELTYRISTLLPSCLDIRVAYGTTETGKPGAGIEIKIINTKTGYINRSGQPARGHSRMIGYWRDDVKTREVIDECGWYRTGDLVVMDSQGYMKIIGRIKDIIVRAGENIYPQEVEDVLDKNPAILKAYVCGVPDDRMGEEVCAWIKLNDNPGDKLNDQEVKQYCKQRMAKYKVPRYIMFVGQFPCTPAGKVKKYSMSEQSCLMLGLTDVNNNLEVL